MDNLRGPYSDVPVREWFDRMAEIQGVGVVIPFMKNKF